MKWMDKFLNNFTKSFEAESEAYQAGSSERGMLIEQQRNRGAAEILAGSGMFTLGENREEQR